MNYAGSPKVAPETAIVGPILRTAARSILSRHPKLWFDLRQRYRALRGRLEPEFALLHQLADPRRPAIDVGANVGAYSYRLSQLCPLTLAIEPHPDLAAELRRMLPANVRVVQAAVSDRTGEVLLRIPNAGPKSSGLATIEPANALGGSAERTIATPCMRLDDIDVDEVGFIKIDVEGHELAALTGARALIARCRPNLLVEAEERHRPEAVSSITESMRSLDYEGFMLGPRRQVTPIAAFDPLLHQALTPADLAALDRGQAPPGYIANFIFIPREHAGDWRARTDS